MIFKSLFYAVLLTNQWLFMGLFTHFFWCLLIADKSPLWNEQISNLHLKGLSVIREGLDFTLASKQATNEHWAYIKLLFIKFFTFQITNSYFSLDLAPSPYLYEICKFADDKVFYEPVNEKYVMEEESLPPVCVFLKSTSKENRNRRKNFK